MQTIGRYEIQSELGEGATAAVFLAYDPHTRRQVAIKVLPYGRADDPLFTHLFRREAETIAALSHPAIAPVYDFGWHGEQLYMVMRYLPGGSLLDRLRAGAILPEQLNSLIQRVAGALDEAHGRDIIHRDVKPANILYDLESQAYLADFGLAKLARHSSSFTRELVMGTPHYMSPEHIRGETLDGRADLYALGVVLFECLTRRLPYPYKDPVQAARAALSDPIPSVHSHRPDLPAYWDTILQKALAKNREERYQTAVALAADVDLAITRRWHLRALGEQPTG
ncbi:MAG TPA: serine/threonine-protein kinase [Chloroflexota bacterium]|nr:serine/threonine-protein kinase [Chloroflexota bacterium]